MTDVLYADRNEITTATGDIVGLAPKECAILTAINYPYPLAATRWEIAQAVWGDKSNWPPSWQSSLSVQVKRIRDKTRGCTFSIASRHGVGYRRNGELKVAK